MAIPGSDVLQWMIESLLGSVATTVPEVLQWTLDSLLGSIAKETLAIHDDFGVLPKSALRRSSSMGSPSATWASGLLTRGLRGAPDVLRATLLLTFNLDQSPARWVGIFARGCTCVGSLALAAKLLRVSFFYVPCLLRSTGCGIGGFR